MLVCCVLSLLFTQKFSSQVSAYTFTQSSGTYTPIGGAVLGTATGNASGTSLNSEIFPVTLPFGFNFNGTFYTSLNVSTNGFVTFGATPPTGTTTSPISGTVAYEGAVSVWGRDINSVFDIGGATGNISWETLGTAPNREVVIQWRNFRPAYSISAISAYAFSFQIRLQETSNIINMVYNSGGFLAGSTGAATTAQIGLRGSSNTDFNTRLNAATADFSNSAPGTANSSTQASHTINPTPGMPPTGLTYTWTPPICYVPTGLTVNSSTSASAAISWSASPSSPSGYDIYYNTSNTSPTSSTVPVLQNVSGLSTTVSSLLPAMTYYIWIRSNCGTGNVSVWTASPVIFRTNCEAIAILSFVAPAVCPGLSAVLSATSSPGTNIIWYDVSGNIVGTGNSFTTPALTSATTYYAAASSGNVTSLISTGKSIYTANPSSGSGTTEFGLVFDVLTPFTLKNVTIYPTSATGASGNVVIDVVDSEGALVHTKSVNVTASPTASPVAQVVTLDFPMVVGSGYKIRHSSRGTGIGGLLFDPSANATAGNFGYPYTTSGVLSINTSTLSANNSPRNDLYYYFYDWKIGPGCESAKVPVVVTVDASCLSTSESDAKDKLKVYPNPFSDVIHISDVSKVKSIKVSDVSGKVVRSISKPESELRMSELPNGMYILVFEMNDGSMQTIKAIKK